MPSIVCMTSLIPISLHGSWGKLLRAWQPKQNDHVVLAKTRDGNRTLGVAFSSAGGAQPDLGWLATKPAVALDPTPIKDDPTLDASAQTPPRPKKAKAAALQLSLIHI